MTTKSKRAPALAQYPNREDPKPCRGAKPCPFCGAIPEIQPWHGGAPTKKMIACHNEDCDVAPSVTGESRPEALRRWNTRSAD